MPELAVVTLHFIMPALKIALFASIILPLHIQLQIPMIHNSCKILTASCKNPNLAILFTKILHKFAMVKVYESHTDLQRILHCCMEEPCNPHTIKNHSCKYLALLNMRTIQPFLDKILHSEWKNLAAFC